MRKKGAFGIILGLLLLMMPFEAIAVSKSDVKGELSLGETTQYSFSEPGWKNMIAYSFEPDRDAVYVFSASGADYAELEIFKVLSSGELEDLAEEEDQLELALFKGNSYILNVSWYCEDELDDSLNTSLSVSSRAARIADSGICGEDMTWELDELGNLSIVGNGLMSKHVYKEWEDAGVRIRTVTISEGVEDIGDDAFSYESELTSVELPSTLKTIGSCSFENCKKLKKIVIPNGVTCIRSYAFDGCRKLGDVTMSNSIVKMGFKAFYDTALRSVSLPESIEFIGTKALGYSYIDGSVKKDSSFIVMGYKGSAAENYAKDTKLTFETCGTVTIKQPELVSITENKSYIKLRFKSVPYATKYYIYRKIENGAWEKFETVLPEEEGKYDPDVEEEWVQSGTELTFSEHGDYECSGDVCYYSVQAVNGTVKSSYDKVGLAWKYVDTPDIEVYNENASIDVETFLYHGVVKYTIYRKVANGEWKSLKTKNISVDRNKYKTVKYKDKDVASGKLYSYRMKIYYKSSDGETCTKTSSNPKITRIGKAVCSVSNVSAGVSIKWDKVKNAKGYYVYKDFEVCKKISDKSTTSFVDKKAVNGEQYEYYVVAYAEDGSKGCISIVKEILYLKKPSLSSVANVSTRSALLKWKENKKADGIQIQYTTDQNMKKNVKTVTIKGKKSLSKKISGLTKGKKYYFRIRFYGANWDDKKCYSSWSGKKSVKIIE